MTNEASPTIRILGQGGCGKSPVFKRIGHKAYRRGYWFLHQSCPCAVPIGLRNRLVESLFPTLKRGANQLCASGAFMPTFLMQSQYSFTLFCCIYGTTESLSAHCSAGFQTGCTGGFQAARDGGCRSGDLHDSRSGERRYKFRSLRISSELPPHRRRPVPSPQRAKITRRGPRVDGDPGIHPIDEDLSMGTPVKSCPDT
jgi:hypothetical protein